MYACDGDADAHILVDLFCLYLGLEAVLGGRYCVNRYSLVGADVAPTSVNERFSVILWFNIYARSAFSSFHSVYPLYPLTIFCTSFHFFLVLTICPRISPTYILICSPWRYLFSFRRTLSPRLSPLSSLPSLTFPSPHRFILCTSHQ